MYAQLCSMLLFLVLAVNSDWFQILPSYKLLLELPFLCALDCTDNSLVPRPLVWYTHMRGRSAWRIFVPMMQQAMYLLHQVLFSKRQKDDWDYSWMQLLVGAIPVHFCIRVPWSADPLISIFQTLVKLSTCGQKAYYMQDNWPPNQLDCYLQSS